MLASSNRLKTTRDITRVFKRGRYGNGGEITVKAAPSGLAESRTAIVVSKKISKKAVVRNRIRRRISGALEEQWATVASGYDIVITVRSDVSDQDTKSLSRDLAHALNRVGILSKEE